MDSSFTKLYKDIKDAFGDGKLTTRRIIIITPRIVVTVQEIGKIRQLSGQEKKEMFFQALSKFVDDADLTEQEKEDIQDFVDSILPFIVDAIVFAYKSNIFRHLKKKCFKSCTS